ncbi:motility associated factor glycosyltransferase family protein [Novispirillum itersonii]|uniref:DUF115 domain-containing protein n=1 Tax=Novispirillum itersonii TaxID=189 RepID=A0A7W9ZDB4_NOVIT|nr:6-hydroxymethylpterin diphosphokinase MptE-like protein [Novispirillum itersonii]MBB6209260.1 hypothetical protein [Novispirillum itersonii]
MTSLSLYDRNAEAIQRHLPALWDALSDVTPFSTVVWDGDVPVNIDLGGASLYPEPVQSWNERQMADIPGDPGELIFGNILHCNPTKVIFPMVNQVRDFIDEKKIFLSEKRKKEFNFSIILGVGLGLHIPALTSSEEVKHFIIYEPTLEFIKHSLNFANWHELLERKADGKVEVTVLWGLTPEEVSERIRRLAGAAGPEFIEGTTIHPHYYSVDIKDTFRLVRKILLTESGSSGFFEDELNMLCNTTRNLLQTPSFLLKKIGFIRKNIPAFIVAAGPSLDTDIERVKELSDRAIIVSCGTSLGILLKAGVTPDIHVENENVPATKVVLDDLASKFDLSKIILAATTSIIPGVASHFAETWFYYRAGLSSTYLFSSPSEAQYGCFPFVANAALSVLIRLGFGSIYLFGCDCGSKDVSRHHASGSVYHSNTLLAPEDSDQRWKKSRDRVLPGNFGGSIYSTHLFDLCRYYLGLMGLFYHAGERFNCSDGAKIDGFIPLDSYDIELPEPAMSKEQVFTLIRAQLEIHKPSDLADQLRERGSETVLKAPGEFVGQLKDVVSAVEYGASPYRRLSEDVHNLLQKLTTAKDPACLVMETSIRSMVRISAYFGTRIDDEQHAREFFEEAKSAILNCADVMAQTCHDAFLQWCELPDNPFRPIAYFE